MKLKSSNIQLRIGLISLAVILLSLASVLVLRDPAVRIDLTHRLAGPSPEFPLGADSLGRDLLSCVVAGAGVSLSLGIVTMLAASLVGTFLGLVSGLAGGLLDFMIIRLVDIVLAFPGILLAVALAAFFNPGPWSLVGILTFSSWAGFAKLTRAEVLKYKQKEFIQAARSYNASFFRILYSHLLPLVLPLVWVQVALGIAGVILTESSLNFLGLGLNPEIPTLGQLVDAGMEHIFDRPVLVMAPGLVLFILIITFNFIGEGLRRKFTR